VQNATDLVGKKDFVLRVQLFQDKRTNRGMEGAGINLNDGRKAINTVRTVFVVKKLPWGEKH